jgi:hypothetical protein
VVDKKPSGASDGKASGVEPARRVKAAGAEAARVAGAGVPLTKFNFFFFEEEKNYKDRNCISGT